MSKDKIRVVFMGTPAFAAPVLQAPDPVRSGGGHSGVYAAGPSEGKGPGVGDAAGEGLRLGVGPPGVPAGQPA